MYVQKLKRIAIRGLLSVEIIVFAGIYWYGDHGVKTLARLRSESTLVAHAVAQLHHDVENVQQELVAWDTNPFYKEKIAREHLQMAREGDTVYYLS